MTEPNQQGQPTGPVALNAEQSEIAELCQLADWGFMSEVYIANSWTPAAVRTHLLVLKQREKTPC